MYFATQANNMWYIHPWVAKCIEVDGGIFEHLLWMWTNLSFPHYNRIEVKLTVKNFLFYQWQCFCICRFKQLYLSNHSELDTCSYELFFLTMTSQTIDSSSWITLFVCCSVFMVWYGIKYRDCFILSFCVHYSSWLYKTGTAYTAVLESHWLIF
jgi:hypothetical protein